MSIYGLSGAQRRVFSMVGLGRGAELTLHECRTAGRALVRMGLVVLDNKGAELTAEGLRLRAAMLMEDLRQQLEGR
ncbi:MAG: hypothetical protein ACRD1P_07325 [Thermoanaerobaculia bacterium]